MLSTPEAIRAVFTYRIWDGRLCWKIKPSCEIAPGTPAGFVSHGRRVITYQGRRYPETVLVWTLFKGELPKRILHRNKNPLDSRAQNLYRKGEPAYVPRKRKQDPS